METFSHVEKHKIDLYDLTRPSVGESGNLETVVYLTKLEALVLEEISEQSFLTVQKKGTSTLP